MVAIAEVRAANAALVKTQPIVAVFVGGTSGIGQGTIYALSKTHGNHGQGLRVYIVGRNAAAAESTILQCREVAATAQFHFVRADNLTLLKDVDRVCTEIKRLEAESKDGRGARVDILVVSQALLNLEARQETAEGLDQDMSLLYYSRMRFINQLLPLLLASPLPAHVISIYAAGMEAKLFQEDLSLRNPEHYSFANCRSHVAHMKTLFMEALAKQHPGRLSLVHVYPGLVITDAFGKMQVPWWMKLLLQVMLPILRPFTEPPEVSGERMLFLASPRFPAMSIAKSRDEVHTPGNTVTNSNQSVATGTDGVQGSGAYAVDNKGETIPATKLQKTYHGLRTAGFPAKVWEHTMQAFHDIETKDQFTE